MLIFRRRPGPLAQHLLMSCNRAGGDLPHLYERWGGVNSRGSIRTHRDLKYPCAFFLIGSLPAPSAPVGPARL